MTECVQFFNAEGMLVEKFTNLAPQYKIVQFFDDHYKWYRLKKDCTYEQLGEGSFKQAFYAVVREARRVNSARLKLNWSHHRDLFDCSAKDRVEVEPAPDGKAIYCTVDGVQCFNSQVAVWKIHRDEEFEELFVVYRQLDHGVWVKVFTADFYTCQQFCKDPRAAIIERLVELYRSNRSMALYRFVANLQEDNTMSVMMGETIADLVEEAINYTPSWTAKAIRVGTSCIARDGRSSTLPRPEDLLTDWCVTQLCELCKLSHDEVWFLVDSIHLSPVMTGEEVTKVVRDYLTDPERTLMRSYKAVSGS